MFHIDVTIIRLYVVFLILAVALSVLALRNPFYIPDDLGLLKHPVWITLSRVAELVIDVGIMIYLADLFRRQPDKLFFTAKLYFWTGVASALYSIFTLPLNLLKIVDLGSYNIDHRMRGFYNEGGPYGLYLATVILLGLVLYRAAAVRRSHLSVAALLLGIAFFGSHSKAAFGAVALLLLVNALLMKGFVKKLAVVLVLGLVAVIANSTIDVPGQLRAYQRGAQAYERLSNYSATNGNLVYGRVAGIFIIPRMIEAHPWLGVGWGNYGLVRNDSQYRGASAWAIFADTPGLGIFDNIAELGVPLALLLVLCLLTPFLYLRRSGAPLSIQNLALVQPLVHIFGGQLNLTYPWIATALALALGYFFKRSPVLQRHSTGFTLPAESAFDSISLEGKPLVQ